MTCPQVTLGVCGGAKHLASPRAGQASAWGGQGGSNLSCTACEAGGASCQASLRTTGAMQGAGTAGPEGDTNTCGPPAAPVLEGHRSHMAAAELDVSSLLSCQSWCQGHREPCSVPTSCTLSPVAPSDQHVPMGAGERLWGALAEPAPAPVPPGRKMEKNTKVLVLASVLSILPSPKLTRSSTQRAQVPSLLSTSPHAPCCIWEREGAT